VCSWVIAIGNPLMFDRSVTVGVISAKNRDLQSPLGDIDLPDLLQTDAAINPGNSGGALVNLDGEVIGIPTVVVRAAQAEGLGFAVTIDRAKDVVEAILKYGHVPHPWLGVTYRELGGPGQASGGRPPDGRGALVVQVEDDGPAARAGIRPGDVIRRVNTRVVASRDDLRTIARALRIGQRIPIIVWRQGREQTLQVKVGEMPDVPDIRKLFPASPR
jgi:serine protease Do